jgi:hypothetical protein
VAAGESFNITFSNNENKYNPPSPVNETTAQGGGVEVNYYPPGYSVTLTVINTLGIAESTTFQP